MVGVTGQGRVRHGGLPQTHGIGTDLLKLPTGPPLSFSINPHSPSADSEGTEFFDALDEIPWTPERPRHRPPTVAMASTVQQVLWSEGDDVQGSEPTSNNSGGCKHCAYSTSKPGTVCAPPQEQEDTEQKCRLPEEKEPGLNLATSPRPLFPSKASMLKLEVQRSISAPRLQVEPRLDQESALNSRGLSATEASPSKVNGRAEGGLESWEGRRSPEPVEDVVAQVDESSTASGASITEGGWDGIHGLEDVDGPALGVQVGERTKREKWEGGMPPAAVAAAVAAPIRTSLRRVFVNPRRIRQQRTEVQLKRPSSGKPRSNDDADGASSHVDSCATSPDGIPALEEAEDEVPDALTGEVDAGVDSRFFKRDARAAKEEDTDGPPEVKMHRHGRGAGRRESWRSMHMVQCLRYHKGPVWTLEFNRHGTRMATGGEDGKVVVWNLAIPAELKEATGVRTNTEEQKGTGSVAQPSRADDDAESAPDSEIRPGTTVGTDDVAGRYAAPAESMSSASGLSDEATSLGLGSSDLWLYGSNEGKRNFTGLEVFESAPMKVFQGHKSDVVDLSWSHSDFLISASIDHKVMLWHPLREERLGTFTHPDFVTSVQFHPLNDHIFLTGCFDKRLRLWTVTNGRVVNWVQCPDMISSARFTPDGQLTVAGLYDGRVIFHHTTDLRYYTQIHCRNRHGTHRRGKKVTGLNFIETSRLHHGGWQADKSDRPSASGHNGGFGEALASGGARASREPTEIGDRHLGMGKANSMSAQYSLLSTTNDSRLRIYDLDNYTMTSKFKGLVNDGIQIKASFSEDGVFVISGSEDGQVYLWNSKRQRTSISSGGSPSHRLDGSSAGGGSSAVPSSSTVAAANAGAAAISGPVKYRESSSFSVQCCTRPKVATVAVFFPSLALDAVLVGGALAYAPANPLPRSEGATEEEMRPHEEKRDYHRAPSLPLPGGADVGDDDAVVPPRRRRWTFGGNARFGGGSGGCRGKKPRNQQPSTAPPMGMLKSGLNTLSPPEASFTSRPSLASAENPMTLEGESQPEAVEPPAEAPTSVAKMFEEWRKVGRFSLGGKMMGIVSADYSGDVKVFFGFVDQLDSTGL